MIPPPAEPMKSKSKLIERGPPEVYQLPLVQSRSGRGVIQYTIGKPPQLRVPVSVVMVVGATGAGKSTWINGMANYVLGVKWKDPFRFKLVNDGTGSEAHSKTKEIIAYTIYRQEGSPFPNTLTIIDTPGFGNTEGMKRDQITVEQVREFLSMGGVEGIDCLHAIGLVTQASMVRLTCTQKYIFDSILSIFGNDVKHNILLMTTFADNRKPAVLDVAKAADIPYTKFFKFNNSALFSEPPDAQFGYEDGGPSDALYWKLCMDSFDKFAKYLVTMQAQILTLTREVLEERQQLEIVLQSLQVQMKLWVRKIGELKQEERCMEENVNNPRVHAMVANIQAKIRSTYDETVGLVVQAQQTLQRLDEIALKPLNPLSQVEYIDLLIQCEKEEGKDGYQERIQYLNEVRGRAELLSIVRKYGCDVHQVLEEAVRTASGTPTDS